MMADHYNEEFFEWLRQGALRSAEVIVPLVLELIRPRSVVDVGCGTGSWLATFARHGVTDYFGVDGFAPTELLDIPRDRFVEADLTRPLDLGREFDLAVSLEVGEHLPDSAAKVFVESLTRLAPVVLFSAAIPGQGGTNHVNEQWPEYWARLFAAHGFDPADVVRPRIWKDPRVEVWYVQNTVLYAARNRWAEFPGLDRVSGVAVAPLAAVHPRLFEDRDRRLGETLRAHAEATTQAERLGEALAAERENLRTLGDKLEHLEQVTAEEHARAERYLQEGTRHQIEAAEAQVQLESSRKEAEWQRRRAADARAQAEVLGQEAQRARADAERLHAEVERFRFMSEPSKMCLRDYLRALPQVVRGALRRALRRTPEQPPQ